MKKTFTLLVLLAALITSACQSAASGGKKSYTSDDSQSNPAASYRTGRPYNLMGEIPDELEPLRTDEPEIYVRSVCSIINSKAKNDFERVKMAHDFVVLFLKYDGDSYQGGKAPSQEWQAVLASGLALAEGYSSLLKKFLDVLGFANEKIRGYGRGAGFSLEGERVRQNHVWNVVTIRGRKYLIDPAWNSGYMSEGDSVRQYASDYLFCTGEEFIYSHYPNEPAQQLLKKPMSQSEFSLLPHLRPNFFDAARLPSSLKRVNHCQGEFSFSYAPAQDAQMSYSVRLKDGNSFAAVENACLVQNDGRKETALFAFPQAGTYAISIFQKLTGAQSPRYCGEFCVVADSASGERFPKFFSNRGIAQLLSPLRSPLAAGMTYAFSVRGKIVSAAVISDTDEWNYLKGDGGGTFSGQIRVPEGAKSIRISVNDGSSRSYWTFAEYEVR